jgi:hypothetical protein
MQKIPFHEDELQILGDFIAPATPFFPFQIPRYNTPVTPKENLLAAVRRENPQWFPMMHDLVSIESRTNTDHIARAEVVDGGPPLTLEEKGGPDLFGVIWEYEPDVKGSMVRPGNPVLEDVNDWPEVIRFPDVDKLNWEQCRQYNERFSATTKSLSVTFQNGLFERLISFMGFGNAAMALVDEDQKDAIHALFSRLCLMYEAMIDKYLEILRLDGVVLHDDWGGQRSPFFSLQLCREMIVPYLKHIADHCHSKGLWFQQHCCGKNEMLVPAMLDAGVDMWFPQSIVDVDWVRETYGDKLIIAIKPPLLQAGASKEDIDAAAKAFVEKYAPGFAERPFVQMSMFCEPTTAPALLEKIYTYSRLALSR